VDNGTEFTSKALDHWAYKKGVQLDFIRPGRPVENGYIESFNGGVAPVKSACIDRFGVAHG
jgi:putative transposase